MKKPEPCVIDTMVLRKANAPFEHKIKEGRDFGKRIALLKRIHQSELQILVSSKLLHEYRQQVIEPRNDFIKLFFEILTQPDSHKPHARWNYHTPWSGSHQARQHDCRFPPEDEHVLRTAVLDKEPSTIFSEEDRMLKTGPCIYRHFGVHVKNPVKP